MPLHSSLFSFFFFNDTATTEIYTLSLHDALPIYEDKITLPSNHHLYDLLVQAEVVEADEKRQCVKDRKSTRLNSSHSSISYAVFCLKKKKKNIYRTSRIIRSIMRYMIVYTTTTIS